VGGGDYKHVTCFSPLDAYRRAGGGITFTRTEGVSLRPLALACGQCIGCRKERSRQWATRCVHESQLHTKNCFITLTYNKDNLPGDLSVDIRTWQLFAKRLRKQMGPFRFFHCGEYGGEGLRPHYHALLFGHDFRHDRILWNEDYEKRKTDVSETLSEIWGLGFTTVADLTFQSAAYVARYVIDKANGDHAERKYKRFNPDTGEEWQVKPPYITMSRRPGIGADWFTKYKDDVYPDDFVIQNGKKLRPPKYYDRQLPEAELETLKQKRIQIAGNYKQDQTRQRLEVRRTITESKLKRRNREI